MLAAEFLDLLDEQMRKLVCKFGRGPENKWRGEKPSAVPPFGVVQLICCGDFFQLPPIPGRVPVETWRRLDQMALMRHRALLRTGLDQREAELFLNRGAPHMHLAPLRMQTAPFRVASRGASHGVARASARRQHFHPHAS